MSDDEWDGRRSEPVVNKWVGEDEDDDVKDAWDNSDSEDEKPKINSETKTQKDCSKPKSAVKKVLGNVPLTEEEKVAARIRAQKEEDDCNMQLLKDMVGLKENKIDSLVPVTKEDFDQFGKAISEKISAFSTSEHYSDLVENITKDVCVDLNTASLKKLKLHIESLHSAKLKDEKASKSKKSVGKGKSVKMDLAKDVYGGSIGDGFDDMDDFM